MTNRICPTLIIALMSLIFFPNCAGDTVTRGKNADARVRMGTSLYQQGDIRGALQELLKALEFDPVNPETHHKVGLVYRDLGLPDKAIFHIKKALKLKPNYPEAQNSLGTVYLLMREWDMAINQFEKAAGDVMYSTPYISYNNLGLVCYQKREFEKAIGYYRKAVGLFPGYSAAYDNMGLAYEVVKEWDSAVDSYKKAIEYTPNEQIYHLHLGAISLKLKRRMEAEKELQRTIEIDSKSEPAREAQKLLQQIKDTQ